MTIDVNAGAVLPAATQHLTVAFTGLPARTGPLTFGQRDLLHWITTEPDPRTLNQCVALDVAQDLAEGLPIPRARWLLHALLAHHEVLRTAFPHGAPRQHVLARGEIPVGVYAATGEPDSFAHRVAVSLIRGTGFDLAAAPAWTAALVTSGGRLTHVLMVLSHIATDLTATRVLRRHALLLLAGHRLPPAPQPIDVARDEAAESTRRRSEATLAHRTAKLAAAPQAVFLTAPAASESRYGLRLRTTAAAADLAATCQRVGVSQSTVLLALLTTLIGTWQRQRRLTITTLSANRYSPSLQDYVGVLAQDALLIVDLVGSTVDDIITDVQARAIRAYLHSRFDPDAMRRVVREVQSRRGVHFTRDLVFNDRRPSPQGASRPTTAMPHNGPRNPPAEELTWLPEEVNPARCLFYIDATDGELDLTLRADPHAVPPEHGERVLRALSDLLARTAREPVALADVPVLATTHDAADGWHLIDSCRVRVDAVRHLVADALDDRPHLVLVVDTPRGQRLHCLVEDSTGTLRPAEVHAACLRLLPGRPDAMAPHTYRVYRRAPAEPADASAWRPDCLVRTEDGRPPR